MMFHLSSQKMTIWMTVAALMGATALTHPEFATWVLSPAYAGGSGSGGSDNSGGSGSSGGQGSQSGQDNQGGSAKGQAGPDDSSDGVGPQSGSPSTFGKSGGKPAWAQEGIPEVELGRLSVARSPQKVLDQSLAEALASLTPEMIAFYNLDYDAMIAALSLDWDNVALIDSPLQNLALLQDALDGTSQLAAAGVTTDVDTLLAVFIGVASDKTLPISTDTVTAVTTILGTPITGDAAEDLAEAAEAIRVAILAGHG